MVVEECGVSFVEGFFEVSYWVLGRGCFWGFMVLGRIWCCFGGDIMV